MPGDDPQSETHRLRCDRSVTFHAFARASRDVRSATGRAWIVRSCLIAVLAAPALLSAHSAGAQEETVTKMELLTSTGIILLAVFCGAMSFAIMSAFWLIRERGRILTDNGGLMHRIADLRAANERLDALVNASDQCIVVWNDDAARPAILGRLSGSRGIPVKKSDFLAFGRWLATDSAIAIEAALRRLRSEAASFELALVSREGEVLEAQGRVSGSHAFVRFMKLSEERSALSLLKTDNDQLRATLDLVQELFEVLPHPVWLRDVTGRLYWANSAYAKSIDCENGNEAVERNIELLDRDQRSQIAARQHDGRAFWGSMPLVISSDRRMFDIAEQMGAGGSAGMALDRGEAEVIRATLRQTIETHAQTLDHLATAVAMFDSSQQLLFYNSAFQNLWNLSDGFLSGKPTNAQVLDAIRAEGRLQEFPDWRKWREVQLEIYQALEAREDWWHLPDGQTLRVVSNPHSQGGATWVFENVTEQLTLQSNYNALIRIQGETLDNLNEAVAVFGLDGRLRLCNPAFFRFWGLEEPPTGAEAHISTLTERCRDDLADDRNWRLIVEAITGFDDARGDLTGRLETAQGEIFDFSLVRLPEGQTMLALSDVTAAVNIERALKERNEALEQADHLKNRFIQHVSRELRAPLTSIAGFSELLATPEIGRLNAKQSEYVGHISQSADVLTAVIDDILDLATIDAGAMSLDIEEVDLNDTIMQCADELAPMMEEHSIQLQIELASGAETLDADSQRLRQIIRNLMNNAVSFSPDGGTVTVSASRNEEFIDIAIADQGPGVAEENRESIFARFEGRSTGERRKGVGLGLSLARSFCELHGGTLHVEPAGKRGACFVCRLPQRQEYVRQAA